jgi:hypothetical protein
MSDYSDKLKDPRWQKKRLAVLERAGWKCQVCDNDKDTLHVHHLAYKGEPWDAPDELLECLCESCHNWREDFNTFCGARSEAPTKLCYAFVRFASVIYPKQKSKKTSCFALFRLYWHYVGKPDEKADNKFLEKATAE